MFFRCYNPNNLKYRPLRSLDLNDLIIKTTTKLITTTQRTLTTSSKNTKMNNTLLYKNSKQIAFSNISLYWLIFSKFFQKNRFKFIFLVTFCVFILIVLLLIILIKLILSKEGFYTFKTRKQQNFQKTPARLSEINNPQKNLSSIYVTQQQSFPINQKLLKNDKLNNTSTTRYYNGDKGQENLNQRKESYWWF